jgi:hypothetical protein
VTADSLSNPSAHINPIISGRTPKRPPRFRAVWAVCANGAWDTERPHRAQTDLELLRYLKKRVLVVEVGDHTSGSASSTVEPDDCVSRNPISVVIMSYGATPSSGDAHLVVQ